MILSTSSLTNLCFHQPCLRGTLIRQAVQASHIYIPHPSLRNHLPQSQRMPWICPGRWSRASGRKERFLPDISICHTRPLSPHSSASLSASASVKALGTQGLGGRTEKKKSWWGPFLRPAMTVTPDDPKECQLWLGILKINSTNKFAGSRATFHPWEAESSKFASQRIAQRGDTGPTASAHVIHRSWFL